MTHETIRIEIDARGVATLTMARPEKRNALNAVMIAEMTAAAQALGADPAVRAVILTGEGDAFCAGGDLNWMKAQFHADRETRMHEARSLAMMLFAMNTLPKPLIGRVQGMAFGGGVGLMCCCDVAIAVDGAKFGLTETRLGVIPATISPYVIARMGECKARRVFMSSRIFGAQEAVALDIAARATAADELDAAVEAEVAPYLRVAPGAVAASKALARALGPRIDAAIIEETIARLADTWETAEAHEGVTAFLEKRSPAFG